MEQIRALAPPHAVHLWDELIVEAFALLTSDTRLAIVLACVALETFIAWCLDRCAEIADVKPELWHWITHRGKWEQKPSSEERFDSLLKALIGCSLREDKRLGKAYDDLRKARNKFVHEGRPYLLSNTKNLKPVTEETAGQLVSQAQEIIDWVEARLPEELRRLRLQYGPLQVHWPMPLEAPPPAKPTEPGR